MKFHTLYLDKLEYEHQKSENEHQRTVNDNNFKTITDNLGVVADKLGKVADKLDNMLKEARDSRKEERKQFSNLLNRQEKLFGRQEQLLQQSINTITGGDTYGYFWTMAPDPENNNNSLWIFEKVGNFPLYGVDAIITDLDKKHQWDANEAFKYFLQGDVTVNIGDLPETNNIVKYIRTPIPLNEAMRHSYGIYFTARNGRWFESLHRVTVNGRIDEAIQVKDTNLKVLFERIPENFPRDK